MIQYSGLHSDGWRARKLGWIIEAAIDWFSTGFIERMSKGRPWWVRTIWTLSALLLVGAFVGTLWLLLR